VSLTSSASRAHLVLEQKPLLRALTAALGRKDAVTTRAFDRVVSAVDASHYLLTPDAVVVPQDIPEIAQLFRYAIASGRPLTFRSGGTSLSGQASTDNILVDTRAHFRRILIDADGVIARVQPGATVRQVNTRLLRHGRKLGPDPASEIACTIGGVVANNSSGMACGTAQNTYNTLRSAIVVLPSGTVVDTSLADAEQRLLEAEPELCSALMELRERIASSDALRAEVERQFAIKNTMGYSLNALVDFDSPAQILTHLMVGSEGTLGFVAEASFNTVALMPAAATTLLVFDSLQAATDSLLDLIATEPATIELMDSASLRAALKDEESRATLPKLDIVNHCALLVEYQAPDDRSLNVLTRRATKFFARLKLAVTPELTRDPALRASLWHIRKGLYATVAGARPSGTTALLEDVAVPVAKLSETCSKLLRLFDLHGYDDAVIFGHAKDGNIHFLVNENFDSAKSVARYRSFTEDMVEMVLGAGGTLKAEHGTGRIMAPFVERQYGAELYEVMRDIKRAFDPNGILNPDIILTTDQDLHVKNLKSTPTVEDEVDRCVECGYCEPVCPSKDLTTTPRQRIVVRRAIAQASADGNRALERSLTRAQDFDVIETCAVDGMCQTACPVRINTGDLIRHLRTDAAGGVQGRTWNLAARHWKIVSTLAGRVLTLASKIPEPLIAGPNRLARAVFGADTVPLWSRDLPRGGRARELHDAEVHSARKDTPALSAVFFQACVGSMFGPADGGGGVAAAFESLAEKSGIVLTRPVGLDGLCCGTPWKSKGIEAGYAAMVTRTVDALWLASDSGRLPVVCDNSSCSEGLVTAIKTAVESHSRYAALRVVDSVDFAAEYILPRVTVAAKLSSVVVHPTCSSTRSGSNENLMSVARAFADEAVVPDAWGCCGFAGDRGMLHPELTKSATVAEADEIASRFGQTVDAFVSCNRTCEIGMSRATGEKFVHVLETLDARAQTRGDAPPKILPKRRS
jgi:D-lactate dehydrogenase